MSDQVPAEKNGRRTRWRRILVIGVLLPLVAASVLIWSATGREVSLLVGVPIELDAALDRLYAEARDQAAPDAGRADEPS